MEALPIWFDQGACRKLGIEAINIMAPDLEDSQAVEAGRVVCIECPVENLCLEWARKNRRGDPAIYGAHTGPERTRMDNNERRKRQRNGRNH